MHKFINDQIPSVFSDLIKRLDHKYPTNFSQSSFHLKRYYLTPANPDMFLYHLYNMGTLKNPPK